VTDGGLSDAVISRAWRSMLRGVGPQAFVAIYVGAQVIAIAQWVFDGTPTATAASFIWHVVAGLVGGTVVLLLVFGWYCLRCSKDPARGA
jgi:hypothetical protein